MNHNKHISQFYSNDISDDKPNKRYLISSASEIVKILKNLTAKPELITVYLENTSDFHITALLGVDEKNFCLYLDDINDYEKRKNILSNSTLTITTQLNGMKYLFPVNVIGKTMHKEHRAFKVSFPDYVLKLQRREYFRATPPLDHTLKCHIKFDIGNVDIEVADISEGGLSLVDRNHSLLIDTDTVLKSCRINLPKFAVIESDLKIHRIAYSKFDPKQQTRYVGCEYLQPDNMMSSQIRRYILKVERYNRASDKTFK